MYHAYNFKKKDIKRNKTDQSRNPQSKKKVELDIRGRIETIQTTALLKSARIHRRVLET